MMRYPITAPSFDDEERRLVDEALSSGWVTQGPKTAHFEALFRERHQVAHALATTSCTAALHLSTAALELGPGDEVIIPAFTWITSANAAEYVGAKAVFAEVDLRTFNLDPKAFEAAITPRTKAVVVVHLFGLSADMDPILEIARKHGLAVIEDAACAVGTEYGGTPVGGLGTLGCFSFHPRKVITTGEGGMVTAQDADLARKVHILRNHGATPNAPGQAAHPWSMSPFATLGYNLRLSDIQAAVGVAQMAKLDRLVAHRQACGGRYTELLSDVSDLALPGPVGKCGHTYQSYVVRVLEGGRERRNGVMTSLAEAGVQTRPGTHAVHRLDYYREKYDLRAEQFPLSCEAEDTTITLPLFPAMKPEDQEAVVDAVKKALGT